MKKNYNKPVVEKVTFDYSQVVAASGKTCWSQTTTALHASDCEETYNWHDNQSA